MLMIKTPSQIRIAQQNYIKETEDKLLQSLIEQFNTQMSMALPNCSHYDLRLFVARPAAFTDLSNVRKQFIMHCNASKWIVRKCIINECYLDVTVSPHHV